MCTELCSDSEKMFRSGIKLRNSKNFDYENYSACGRKLSTNFSLIHYFSCYNLLFFFLFAVLYAVFLI